MVEFTEGSPARVVSDKYATQSGHEGRVSVSVTPCDNWLGSMGADNDDGRVII